MLTLGKLTIAFAVTEAHEYTAAGDYFTAHELAIALASHGHDIRYLALHGEKDWYDIGEEVDVLIAMLHDYDLTMIKNVKKGLVTIAWMRNHFKRWCANASLLNYSILLASSETACKFIKKHTGRWPGLFPIATNHRRFNINKTRKENEQVSEYAFTGNYWNVRRDVIEMLKPSKLPYKFKLYGRGWGEVPDFKPYWAGFVKYEDMPDIYSGAEIVIDDANNVTKEFGAVNSRVYDALAAGCLVLTSGEIGAKETFGILPYFTNSDELHQMIAYYMENTDIREKLTMELRELVLNNHTYEIRANSLIDIITDYCHKIAIMMPAPDWSEIEEWGDYHFALALSKYFMKNGFHTEIRTLNNWNVEFDGMYVLVLRGLHRYFPKAEHVNIIWNISHPDTIESEEYNMYDAVLVASTKWAEVIKGTVSVPVYSMLQCTDSELFCTQEINETEYELLFVGNSRNVMRKIIEDLLPTDKELSVYGAMWKNLIDSKYVKGRHIQNKDLAQYYSRSKILLNDHWDDMREKGFISNRLFDGLAAGAFIISDDVESIKDVLEDSVVTYKNREDLEKKINYYLEHPEERRRLAQKGKAVVLSRHTFDLRTKCIINIFLECALQCQKNKLKVHKNIMSRIKLNNSNLMEYSQVIVYGAGQKGQQLLEWLKMRILRKNNVEVWDANYNNIVEKCGYKVKEPNFTDCNNSGDVLVIIALSVYSNPLLFMEIEQKFIEVGYENVISSADIIEKAVTVQSRMFEDKAYDDYQYETNIDFSSETPLVKSIAFYLPQFHEIPENNEWWGKGFTEWTNTSKTKPNFNGHYQPREPHDDFGYYDLKDVEVIRKQAKLAKQHGIFGWCIYYYWFSGKKLLTKPIDLILKNEDIDINYCLMWCNESWSKRWVGKHEEILLDNEYKNDDPEKFIDDIKKYINDKRYIKFKGKPLILIYKADNIPNVKDTVYRWRKRSKDIEIGEIAVFSVKRPWSLNDLNLEDIFEGETEFCPMYYSSEVLRVEDEHGVVCSERLHAYGEFTESYKSVVETGSHESYLSCVVGYDNTPRYGRKSELINVGFSREQFYNHVKYIVDEASVYNKEYIFIFAWNEWAESAYLEPDKRFGYAMINTFSKAIHGIPLAQ